MVKILIIGGGIGGLVLAQYLRKNNVEFEVFERDESALTRVQGWALSLQGSVPSDLSKIVPSSAPPIESVRVSRDFDNESLDGGAFYLAPSNKPKFLMDASTGLPLLRANRARLRQWLATDLAISWNKRYTRHNVGQDGKVTAYFSDGSSAVGDMLVGADGVSSHVRMCLDETDSVNILPVGIIAGDVHLNPDQITRQRALAKVLYGVATHDCLLFVGLRDSVPGLTTAEYYWTFQFRDESVPQAGMDYWALKASAAERLEFVKSQLSKQNFHPDLREIVDLQQTEHMLDSFVLRDHVPKRSPDGPVTLIGDSAHGMAPFRGQGANNAAKDAMLLGKLIVEALQNVHDSPFNAADVIRVYEEDMIPRATGWVLASRAATKDFEFTPESIHTPHKAA